MSHDSTIRTLHSSEDSLIANVCDWFIFQCQLTCIPRDQNTKLMPKTLNVWIGNKIRKNAALSKLIIRVKAKHLYKYFVSDSSEVSNSKAFQGSKGCFKIVKLF